MSSADSADESRPVEGELRDLHVIHDEIDREVARLTELHVDRLQCRRGCSTCCIDDLTVAPVEAERINRAHPELLLRGAPHPVGACAFLDTDGACRVYADRPYVCRTQGLPLRILFENETGEIEERRDICSLNLEGGPPLESLEEDHCWLIGPSELKLGRLNERLIGGGRKRVSLRSLFESS